MSKRLYLACAFISACASTLVAGATASAEVFGSRSEDRPALVLISGGCGLAFHRNPFSVCVPNRGAYFGGPPVVRLPPPCPRFYHRDPDPARPLCYPNL